MAGGGCSGSGIKRHQPVGGIRRRTKIIKIDNRIGDNKVFGIGFSKTGTTSLENALELLGYNVCRGHWKLPHTFYLHALYVNKDYDEIYRLTKHFDAFADAPWGGTDLYEKLYRWYPEAYYIFTSRDPESWYLSFEKLITMFDSDLKTTLGTYYAKGMFGSAYFFEHIFRIKTLENNKHRIIEAYKIHTEEVINFFHQQKVKRFLHLKITEGEDWAKICKFLNKSIPDKPFPHANQSKHNPNYISNTNR